MRRSIVGTLVLLAFTVMPVRAQEGLLASCEPGQLSDVPITLQTQITQVCAQVASSVADLQPSVGMAFSGGNPVLGTGSTLGMRLNMIPRVSVTARANATFVDMPDLFAEGVGVVTADNPSVDALGAVGIPIGALQGDIAVGVFNGVGLGPALSGLGSVDLLGSVAYLPQIDEFGLTDAITNVGVGARVGILQQGLVAPGISVSAMYRRMGAVQFGSVEDDGSGDPAEFAINLRTWSTRAVVSKGLLMVDLAIGAGYDAYTSDAALTWQLQCSLPACIGDPQIITRGTTGTLESGAWNVFADVALNVLVLNIVGEVGYQKTTDPIGAEDLTGFGLEPAELTTDDLSGGRLFGSLGVRVAL